MIFNYRTNPLKTDNQRGVTPLNDVAQGAPLVTLLYGLNSQGQR